MDLVTIYRSTDLHGRLEQYEHRLQDAEDASQSKTTFLSRMSHEIRTPMNGIIGMLTLAKSRLSADNPAMQYLHKADELSDHLLSLINDILDMSRIEAGKVELEHKPFSMRKLGAKVDVVGDGQQAVDAFNGHGVGYYDFILLDVQMPVMDGRTAARTIRRLPRADAAGIPIFALSADAFVEDERLSAEAGMNGHFAKPVDFTALQHSVGRFLAKKERKTL